MIEPFEDRQVREGVISYGVSSYGYDMRVAREFQIFTNVLNSIVDPKEFDPKSSSSSRATSASCRPTRFALARSVEYFRIPRNVADDHASASPPTRAAASSRTSRRSSRSGRDT